MNKDDQCNDNEHTEDTQATIANIATEEDKNNTGDMKQNVQALLASAINMSEENWVIRDTIADALNAIGSSYQPCSQYLLRTTIIWLT